jgi:hypothetical protein
MLDLCLHGGHNVYTGDQAPLNKGDNMPEMDVLHSTILEGYWQGYDAYEIAEQLGEDPKWVATVTDTFRDLGY